MTPNILCTKEHRVCRIVIIKVKNFETLTNLQVVDFYFYMYFKST